MMAVLWQQVDRDITWSVLHFGKSVELFSRIPRDENIDSDYADTMAFMHAMQCGYTSFESAMRRLLVLINEPVPSGAEWHKDLVDLITHPVSGVRPAIIGDKTLGLALDRLRGFRHVATHVYNEFDRDRAALAVKAAETFLAMIEPAIARFRAAIDPDP